VSWDGGLLTLLNRQGFTIEFNGFPLPFDYFRVSTRLDEAGAALQSPHISTKTVCAEIDFYGQFLQILGYCNPTTDLLNVFAAAELRPFGDGTAEAPDGVGSVTFQRSDTEVAAIIDESSLRLDEHAFGLLLVDAATGSPVPLSYAQTTAHEADSSGFVARVAVSFASGQVTGPVRAYLMVDTSPAARADLPAE
jgi:hypothetical protein